MKNAQNFLLAIFVLILFSFTCKAQYPIPIPTQPSEENKILISKLIEVSNYENHFKNYCNSEIAIAFIIKKINTKSREEALKSVNFENFKWTIYNTFAEYSANELQSMIDFFQQLNKNRKIELVLTNRTIEANLKTYVEEMIKGNGNFKLQP